jgi:hypothetical protein
MKSDDFIDCLLVFLILLILISCVASKLNITKDTEIFITGIRN